ncbi:class I SAM-dependent methyltransferase [Conyzicola nivalis]|uniref:Methyltransferase type 11 n=1 Tax=Conyzicola nivalis TaxID=1477021 RepID=A0A916SSM5_9MICO|nr:class I SAM-dependent methyltransferase [Conyzicola nivalis]GGB14514.1 methyltransferase type 11 [Conyzicola nivalis]
MSTVSVAANTFGSGGAEPYAEALRRNDAVTLLLRDDEQGAASRSTMDVARWNAGADDADLTLLGSVAGPVLDIGCGPGRMVRAAAELGLEVLGVDVSPTAIAIATEAGLPVLQGSVFDALPGEGAYQTALLVDGNVGIGGDVSALLTRCRSLLTATGEIVVELHPDDDRDNTYTGRLVDARGGESELFPWAEIGLRPMTSLAEQLGFTLLQSWAIDGRTFCRLA